MSTSIDQAFVKQFEREVHEAYQRQGSKLRGTVRVKTGVVGGATVFQRVGTAAAQTKGRHAMVPVTGLDHSSVEVPLVDFYVGEWIDKLDELKTNIDERQVLAHAGAFALGRKTDELIVQALLGATRHRRRRHHRPDQGQGAAGVRGSRCCRRPRRRPALRGDRLAPVVGPARPAEFASAEFVGDDQLPWRGIQAKRWLGTTWLPHSGLPLAPGCAPASGTTAAPSAMPSARRSPATSPGTATAPRTSSPTRCRRVRA